MNKKVVLHFRGKAYPLLFDLYAMEQIEDEWGSLQAMAEDLDHGKQFQGLRKLFRILGNAALEDQDLPENLTGNEIRRATAGEMREIHDAVMDAIKTGKVTETGAGQIASDEHRELYQDDEEDEKNA